MEIDPDFAELLGAHIGDGCISINQRYSMYYLGGDLKEEKEYHDLWVSKLLNKVMKKLDKPQVRYKEYHSTGVYGVYIFDKEIVDFFMSFGIKSNTKINQTIPEEVLASEELIKRFIRGLFDTGGNLYFDKNRSCKNPINNVPVIKLGTTSEKLLRQIFNLFNDLDFHPRLKTPYKGRKDKNFVYTLLLYRKEDVKRYVQEIGFKNTKHMTKWQVFKKLGYLRPGTTLSERKEILNNNKV